MLRCSLLFGFVCVRYKCQDSVCMCIYVCACVGGGGVNHIEWKLLSFVRKLLVIAYD